MVLALGEQLTHQKKTYLERSREVERERALIELESLVPIIS